MCVYIYIYIYICSELAATATERWDFVSRRRASWSREKVALSESRRSYSERLLDPERSTLNKDPSGRPP